MMGTMGEVGIPTTMRVEVLVEEATAVRVEMRTEEVLLVVEAVGEVLGGMILQNFSACR